MATKPLLRQIETLQSNLRESAKVQEQVKKFNFYQYHRQAILDDL